MRHISRVISSYKAPSQNSLPFKHTVICPTNLYKTSVIREDSASAELLAYKTMIGASLDPFFQKLQRRREENRDKEVECIIAKIKSRISNFRDEPGRIDVFSNYVDDEIEYRVRSRIGDVEIKRNQMGYHHYTIYRVQW